jgi:propanol-preferring alcohol dehydrogenase
MKAAVVHSFDRPLEIDDVPVPEPGADQVLVRIETSGPCHTDIRAARGEWPVKPTLPIIPGHEGVGVVEQLGRGNDHGLEAGQERARVRWGVEIERCAFSRTRSRDLHACGRPRWSRDS